ncbi:MAG: mRNA surveillance protein pelota [Candidatus Bathyarchaeota archaeon]|nr:MAG: mRNA surveillance protein pelota [Candidatus Bathyarchaeota archaeon]
MKILAKNFKKGIVKVVPKTLDDLWHLYNLIYKGDLVFGRTTREIKIDVEYSRPQKGKRVSILLGIRVEDIVWDRSLNRLRVHGRIHEAPEDVVGPGTYHTLNIAVNKPITLVKERWFKHQITRLEQAGRFEAPSIIVVSVDSEEYSIAMIREYGVDVQVEGKARLPGKLEAEKRATALQIYLRNVLNALSELWQRNRCSIVVIGVGFVKNHFSKFVKEEKPEIAQAVVDVKSVNSSGLSGIEEALRSGVLDKTLKNIRIAEETRVMEEVLARLGKEQRDVTYGLEQVEKAEAFGAVETFLVADYIIRGASDEKRLTLEKLMREAEQKGGKIIVVSAEHEAGQKLLALGGVAALLRFPIS